MQYKRQSRWRVAVFAWVVGLGLITIFRISLAAGSGAGPAQQQEVIRLENRITQLEQRLFSLETTLRNIEQQSRMAGATARGVGQDDLARVLAEVQTLERRLSENECGLAKLDERTLAPSLREARRKSGTVTNDPCRVNLDTPLRLPDRRQ
jgi:hypothetical protein